MNNLKQSTLINYLTKEQQILCGSDDETVVLNSEDAILFEKLHMDVNNLKISYINGIPFLENISRCCPHCGKHSASKHDKKERTLHFFEFSDVKVFVQRYKCNKCKKTVMADISSLVPRYHNFTNDFRKKLIDLVRETSSSLFGAKYALENEYDVSISHQTIDNYIKKEAKPLNHDALACSGYLLFDVEWVKLKGIWKYRFSLFDLGENRIFTDKIYDSESKENLEEFLSTHTKNITVKCITTDLAISYRPILSKLGYTQQLCLFHTKMTISKYIGDKIKRLNKTRDNTENKIAKMEFNSNDDKLITLINKYDFYTNEINKYKDLKRDLFDILDTEDIKITRTKLNRIMSNLDEFKGKIKSFVKNRLHDQFMDFNRWKENSRIERTTSKLENAFLKTMPKIFKRKYRTEEGIMAIIYLNEQKWTDNQNRRKYYS